MLNSMRAVPSGTDLKENKGFFTRFGRPDVHSLMLPHSNENENACADTGKVKSRQSDATESIGFFIMVPTVKTKYFYDTEGNL
jgi:hypothetical protein